MLSLLPFLSRASRDLVAIWSACPNLPLQGMTRHTSVNCRRRVSRLLQCRSNASCPSSLGIVDAELPILEMGESSSHAWPSDPGTEVFYGLTESPLILCSKRTHLRVDSNAAAKARARIGY